MAFRAGEKVTVGGGLESTEVQASFVTDDIQSTVLGVTINFNRDWYLGYAMGREDFGQDAPAPLVDVTADRNIQMYGLAYRKGRAGQDSFYFEASILDKEDFNYEGFEFGGYRHTIIALQVQFSVILAGYTAHTVAAQSTEETTGGSAIDLAYVPRQNLSFGYCTMGATEFDDAGDEVATNDFQALTLAYLF